MGTFASNVRDLRKSRGLSQDELASSLGVARTSVANWESRGREPDFDTLSRIAAHFGVTADYLLGRAPATAPDPLPHQPWMDRLEPATRAKLEELGGMQPFHMRFLGGGSLNDLDEHDLEIIMRVYFRHREESERKRKLLEGKGL